MLKRGKRKKGGQRGKPKVNTKKEKALWVFLFLPAPPAPGGGGKEGLRGRTRCGVGSSEGGGNEWEGSHSIHALSIF